MASFSNRSKYAYHVVPLHALKPILASLSLLSKADLAENGSNIRRTTTWQVDELLGFGHFVHFYLPRSTAIDYSPLSILGTQLGISQVSAFPHVVFVLDTTDIADPDCVVCNFNIAVSRPKYPGTGAGNHARGTPAETVLTHWQSFRADNPDYERMRRSSWHEGKEVPVLVGQQITANPENVGYRAKRGCAELLLGSPFEVNSGRVTLHVFSQIDLEDLSLLPTEFPIHFVDTAFAWYSQEDRVDPGDREVIREFFANADALLPDLNFDRHRPRVG